MEKKCDICDKNATFLVEYILKTSDESINNGYCYFFCENCYYILLKNVFPGFNCSHIDGKNSSILGINISVRFKSGKKWIYMVDFHGLKVCSDCFYREQTKFLNFFDNERKKK